MPTAEESICCVEVEQIKLKIEEDPNATNIKCITEHVVFPNVCLNILWVLQASHNHFRLHFGSEEERHTINEYVIITTIIAL